jgi:hypothetical protein
MDGTDDHFMNGTDDLGTMARGFYLGLYLEKGSQWKVW